MKTKNFILIAAMAIGAATMTAFSVIPSSASPDKYGKGQRLVYNANNSVIDTGKICPCSQLRCGICGGEVEWTALAYVKERRKCTNCNGTGYIGSKYAGFVGCTLCDSTGIYVEWASGCRCYHCNQGFSQPDDCD